MALSSYLQRPRLPLAVIVLLAWLQVFNPALAAQSAPEERLAASLSMDPALQDATIIALRRALGARDQTAVVRRGRFVDDIRFYIETYRGIRDAGILGNIQNRYQAARAELLEPRLSDTIEELVTVLETLQPNSF